MMSDFKKQPRSRIAVIKQRLYPVFKHSNITAPDDLRGWCDFEDRTRVM